MSRPPGSHAGRRGHAWREVSARVYREEDKCWLCGAYVDQDLPPTHPRARSADHLVQLQHGGHPTRRDGLRLAHIGCNSARSNHLRYVRRDDCACVIGLPCAVLIPATPRGLVIVDPHTL